MTLSLASDIIHAHFHHALKPQSSVGGNSMGLKEKSQSPSENLMLKRNTVTVILARGDYSL